MKYTHGKNCTCPVCMKWDDFDNIYIDFAMEYSQQYLVYSLASESLSDFPTNIAPHIIEPILAKRIIILENEIKRRGLNPYPTFQKENMSLIQHSADKNLSPELERIRYAFEGVYALARYGKKIPEMDFPDFQRVLIIQNIIVICSFVEGYISNTIRFLCDNFPDPFITWVNKQTRSIKALDYSDQVDSFVFDIGYGNFERKINRIEIEFGIKLPSSLTERKKIKELYLIRNCFVHNSGRVSKQYKESGMAPPCLNIGDNIELTQKASEELLDTLIDVITDLYRSVSLQMLNKTEEQLMFGPSRC